MEVKNAILINDVQVNHNIEEKEENTDTGTFGDIFAISMVGLYTLSVLVVSCWSAVLLLTGNTSNGGPIGLVFNMMQSSGLL